MIKVLVSARVKLLILITLVVLVSINPARADRVYKILLFG